MLVYLCALTLLLSLEPSSAFQQHSVKRSSSFFALESMRSIADPLKQQCTWRLVDRSIPVTTLEDVVTVLCRFDSREEFIQGQGYFRPPDGNLLTAQRMYERLQNLDFDGGRWPVDAQGGFVGLSGRGLSEEQIKSEIGRVR